MEVLYPVCCGLDVHKASVTACLRSPGDGPRRREEVQTFGTSTRELLRLVEWRTAAGCTHVAMESTGVYWRPVYNLLEDGFELLLVNAQPVKMVPGQDGCARQRVARSAPRARPAAPQFRAARGAARAARRLRYRKRLIEERAREANRVLKVLETANIKLGSYEDAGLGGPRPGGCSSDPLMGALPP
jgi:transposase